MNISERAISQILSARGMTPEAISERAGISVGAFRAAVEGETELADDEIESLAQELSVPVSALFSNADLPLLPSVDFRSARPAVARFHRGTLRAFGYVERLSNTLSRLGLELGLDSAAAPIAPALTDVEAAKLANIWRKRWRYTVEQQLADGDANKVYTSLRSFIEDLGVVVVHFRFETDEAAGLYAKVDGGPHTIVINTTRSSKARKLFTLAHEFCHLLLRREGASNPSLVRNSIERFCNHFAANLLAPTELIKAGLRRFAYAPSTDNNFVRLFSGHLGISQEALVRRLVELGLVSQAQYGAWRGQFDGQTPTGDQGARGGRSEPIQNKRTQYGSRLLSLLHQAKIKGQLDEIDIYRLCGLKPRYQNQLFGDA